VAIDDGHDRPWRLSAASERLLWIAVAKEGCADPDLIIEEALRFYVDAKFQVELSPAAAAMLDEILRSVAHTDERGRRQLIETWIERVTPARIQ
jgi:hypothetical protein